MKHRRMNQADPACEELVQEDTRSSERLLIDTDHELILEGEEFLQRLPPRKRIDLFYPTRNV